MIGAAWVGATGAAVTLTWFGVGSVLRGTVYDPPRALPVSGPPADHADAGPDVSSTQRPPEPDGGPTGGAQDGGTASGPPPQPPPDEAETGGERAGEPPGVTPDGEAEGDREPAPPPDDAGPGNGLGSVETVATDGGRVAFDMGPDSAELVSATPAPGWEMQVWAEATYIRVSFSGEGRTVSVFCIFNGHPPYLDQHEE